MMFAAKTAACGEELGWDYMAVTTERGDEALLVECDCGSQAATVTVITVPFHVRMCACPGAIIDLKGNGRGPKS